MTCAAPVNRRQPPRLDQTTSIVGMAGAYLLRYAQERGDNRRLSNGEQVNHLAALSLKRDKSVDFGGYWQRHSKDVHA
jgi:hypothetical protein